MKHSSIPASASKQIDEMMATIPTEQGRRDFLYVCDVIVGGWLKHLEQATKLHNFTPTGKAN